VIRSVDWHCRRGVREDGQLVNKEAGEALQRPAQVLREVVLGHRTHLRRLHGCPSEHSFTTALRGAERGVQPGCTAGVALSRYAVERSLEGLHAGQL